MYVILNIHHDTKSSASASGAGYYPRSSAYSSSEKFVTSVWSQAAEYFKDYDYHLIFETLNELVLSAPAMNGGSTSGAFRQR